MNGTLKEKSKVGVMTMYQIYGLLSILALLWGITIWASIPEEEEDRRY